ncbi:hypothetical protein ACHWQZ_G000821 [Mnemiopsis leidyi]
MLLAEIHSLKTEFSGFKKAFASEMAQIKSTLKLEQLKEHINNVLDKEAMEAYCSDIHHEVTNITTSTNEMKANLENTLLSVDNVADQMAQSVQRMDKLDITGVKIVHSKGTRRGTLLIELQTEEEAKAIVKQWNSECFSDNAEGTVNKTHATLLKDKNCKGIMYDIDHEHSEDFIANEVKKSNLKMDVTIRRFMKGSKKMSTVMITFGCKEDLDQALKYGVKVGNSPEDVHLYKPTPKVVQCFKCFKFDHTKTTTHDSLFSGGAESKRLHLDSTKHTHPLIYLVMTNNRRNSGIPQNKTLTGQKKINKKSQPPPPSSPLLNVDVDEPRYEKCPCASSDKSSWLIKCTKCTQNWHSNCCNLRGIKEDFVTQLEDWQCPLCFTAPGLANVQNKRTEQLLLSMAALQGKNTDLEKAVRHLEDKLSALISDTDQLRTSTKNVAEKLVKLSDIELHIQHRTIQEGQFDDRIKTMSSQLTNLQASFTELKETTESSGQSFSNSPALRPEVKIPNSIEAFVEPSIESLASKATQRSRQEEEEFCTP